MFTLQKFTSMLSFLSFSVEAFLVSKRDVVSPQILQPNASSVWPIGTKQIVTWNTSGFPPAANISNPIGQIILGFNESSSENLDLNNPLAQNFSITDGNVTITVPNVPPRDDYLIVLLGDSGDTSPTFAITPNSNSVTVSGSATALAVSSTSAGWSLNRDGSSLWNSAAPFLMRVAPFIMVFMPVV